MPVPWQSASARFVPPRVAERFDVSHRVVPIEVAALMRREFDALTKLNKVKAMRYKEFDLESANKIMTRRIIVFLIILFAYSLLLSIAEWLGAPIQQLAMLLSSLFRRLTAVGGVSTDAYVVFSASIYLLAPFSVFYICKGDPLHQRWRRAIRQNGVISIKRLVFLYVIGVPSLLALAFVSYYVLSSSRFPKNYNTSGARLFESMANSHISLVLVGPFVAVGIWLSFYFLVTAIAVRSVQPVSKY